MEKIVCQECHPFSSLRRDQKLLYNMDFYDTADYFEPLTNLNIIFKYENFGTPNK